MKVCWFVGRGRSKSLQCLSIRPAGWLLLTALVLLAGASKGFTAGINFEPPISFFTNIASRLLRSDISLDLSRIQIYPTNQYSPAVHRALQVAANLYDASTNRGDYPYPPTVFRPLFTNDNGAVYICGYEEVTNATLAGIGGPAPSMRDLSNSNELAALQSHDMVYGVPVVVGAKKGWPNFNEFAMQTQIQVTRKLQFLRSQGTVDSPVDRTNQMYLLGISNVFGVEAWNSYGVPFPRPLEVIAVVDQVGIVSNEFGVVLGPDNLPISKNIQAWSVTNYTANSWSNFISPIMAYDPSFQVPVFSNYWFLANCQYQFQPSPRFVPLSGVFESPAPSVFLVPRWWLSLRTRVRFILVDTSLSRIADYVNLDSTEQPLDIMKIVSSDVNCGSLYVPSGANGSEWCTNRMGTALEAPTYGILNQIMICFGPTWGIDPNPVNGWVNYFIDPQFGGDIVAARNFFNYQFGMGVTDGSYGKSNVFYAPFSPFRNVHLTTSWSANDPFVHYTIGDLSDGTLTNRIALDFPSSLNSTVTNLGRLNRRYEPWGGGGNPALSLSPTKFNYSLKDPLVSRADNYNFPTNQGFDLTSLGQIHRGTPWQTVYLKSAVPSAATWQKWVGFVDAPTARQMNPTNDWHFVDWLVPLLNTNEPGNLLPVNESGVPAWAAALDGITVLTNSQTQLSSTAMPSNSPQATAIGTALDTARSARLGYYFQGIGDVLATPILSVSSPWLNLAWTNAITDQAYESIPSQLLPRLRPDSIGAIVAGAGGTQLQFTGFDDWRYAVQVSSNLTDWVSFATNSPFGGVFSVSNSRGTGGNQQFYRTLLLP